MLFTNVQKEKIRRIVDLAGCVDSYRLEHGYATFAYRAHIDFLSNIEDTLREFDRTQMDRYGFKSMDEAIDFYLNDARDAMREVIGELEFEIESYRASIFTIQNDLQIYHSLL